MPNLSHPNQKRNQQTRETGGFILDQKPEKGQKWVVFRKLNIGARVGKRGEGTSSLHALWGEVRGSSIYEKRRTSTHRREAKKKVFNP